MAKWYKAVWVVYETGTGGKKKRQMWRPLEVGGKRRCLIGQERGGGKTFRKGTRHRFVIGGNTFAPRLTRGREDSRGGSTREIAKEKSYLLGSHVMVAPQPG